jgi:hypothetical protein
VTPQQFAHLSAKVDGLANEIAALRLVMAEFIQLYRSEIPTRPDLSKVEHGRRE